MFFLNTVIWVYWYLLYLTLLDNSELHLQQNKANLGFTGNQQFGIVFGNHNLEKGSIRKQHKVMFEKLLLLKCQGIKYFISQYKFPLSLD